MGVSWAMNIQCGIFMNLMDHETYLMTHEMQLFGDKNFHGHEKRFSWVWCKRQFYNSWKIYGPEPWR